MHKVLFKKNDRYVVQPRSMDSVSIIIELSNSDWVIALILGVTNNINAIDDLNFHCLKNFVPKHECEVFDKLIIPFLMTL